MTKDEAMQMALDAYNKFDYSRFPTVKALEAAMLELRTALAQPDSITWDVSANNGRVRFTIGVQSFALDYYPENQDGQLDKKQQEWMCKQLHHALSRLETNLSQCKPDTTCERCGKKLGTEVTDIHTCTPKEIVKSKYSDITSDGGYDPRNSKNEIPKKEWVGLTDEDWIIGKRSADYIAGAEWAEAKLKEKND